jgi:plastocyanin
MTSRLRFACVLGAAAVAGGLACGGSDSGGPPPSGQKTVLVANNEFQPTTVNISAGDTIVWAWTTGSIGHNVLSTGAPAFDSDPLNGDVNTLFNAPHSHRYIFAAAGTYAYYCSNHGTPGTGMAGTVVVAP